MAYVEPMDVDNIGSDFDDKENSLQNSNVLPRTPCTEKGYEELDVSELNMKLRYSITPASSPMSKSYTANYKDRISNYEDQNTTFVNENNLTRSLNITLTNCETVTKSPKLPLQALPNEQFLDNTITSSLRRSLDTESNNCTITVTGSDNVDDNLSLPSTSSSLAQTPEAITPTTPTTPTNKDITKDDGGSPIMRGLKSVLNMFRPSQSPIPPEGCNKDKDLSSVECFKKESPLPSTTLASTPININKNKENSSSKRNSPLKDSVTFKDDLERELQWKDETTIIFKQEKIPIHKLFLQQPISAQPPIEKKAGTKLNENFNTTVEYMDISYNESVVDDKTMTEIDFKPTTQVEEIVCGVESDSEFVDCETTYTKNEEEPPKDNLYTDHNGRDDLSSENVKELNSEENKITKHIENKPDIKEDDIEIKENIATTEIKDIPANIKNGDSEIKMDDVSSILSKIQKTSGNSVISSETSKVSCISANHNNESSLTIDIPLEEDLTVNVINDLPPHMDNTIIMDSKNDDNNEEINQKINVPHFTQQISENSYVNENVKPEVDGDIHDVTIPLNIITNYQENVKANTNVVNSSAKKIDMKNDSSQFFGLLMECDAKDNVDKTITVCDSFRDENDTVVLDNDTKLSDTIEDFKLNCNDSNYKEHGLVNNMEATHNEEIMETTKNKLLNETTHNNLQDSCLNNINDINDSDSLKIQSSDPKLNAFDSTIVVTEAPNQAWLNNNLNVSENELKMNIDISNFSEQLLSNTVNNAPADIPLPVDDDIEKNDLTDVLKTPNKSITLSIKDNSGNAKCVIPGNYSITSEISKVGDDIVSILSQVSSDSKQTLNLNKEVSEHVAQDILQPNENLTIETTNVNEINSVEVTNINLGDANDLPIAFSCDEDIKISKNTADNEGFLCDNKLEHEDMPEEKNNSTSIITINENIMKDDANVDFVTNSLNTHVNIDNNKQNDCELDSIENPFETKTKLDDSPPISPKLGSKGYNINFDEIDDPFATKTNIRLSPPPLTSSSNANSQDIIKKVEHKKLQIHNRRKSQTERKRQSITRKTGNTSFDSGLKTSRDDVFVKTSKENVNQEEFIKDTVILDKVTCNENIEPKVKNVLDEEIPSVTRQLDTSESSDNNGCIDSNNITKLTSENEDKDEESEKELLEIAKKSLCDITPRNVFNLPEIDDLNFNPFATKSKVCQSPPPTLLSPRKISEVIEKNIPIHDETINIENTDLKHDSSPNVSNTSCSSKYTEEKENTVREVQTEDEDTIEGPFFEAEELNEIDKISDIESNKDTMPLEDFPIDTEHDKKELFIDAEAFEFLLNQNKSNVVADSGKESLFLKFDPLFAKRVSSDGVLSALHKIQKRQSTPKKSVLVDKINETIEIQTATSSTKNLIEENSDDASSIASKPTMVVNPAVNSLVSPRKSTTPPRINRRSLTFTSPAMAVIDRLLSLSGNSSILDQNTSMPEVTREYNDTDIALTQLRELLAEKEIHVHNLRSETKELKDRLASMELQVKSLEKESEERLRKVNELNNRLAEKTKMNKSMAVVVEEYERTIASLISEMDQEKRRNAEEKTRLISERDEQTAHLASMEVSFSDLHSKYEKSKQIILSMKANEDTYKKSIKEFEDNLVKMQSNYELLKQHATSKLNHANQELEKFNRSHEAEVLKLNAMIKRKELHITSLEESLAQKTKANEELTAICDELINKVG